MHVGRRGARQRLERPELAIFGANRAATNRVSAPIPRANGPLTNPLDKPGHFVGPQRFIGGHFQVAGSPGRLDEQAVIGIAGDDGRTAVAPLVGRLLESSRKPDSCLAGPWHLMQRAYRTGRRGSRTATSRHGPLTSPTTIRREQTATINAARIAVKDLIVLSERNSVTDRNGAMAHIVTARNQL